MSAFFVSVGLVASRSPCETRRESIHGASAAASMLLRVSHGLLLPPLTTQQAVYGRVRKLRKPIHGAFATASML